MFKFHQVSITQMTVGGRSPPEPRLFKSQTSGRQLDAHLGALSLWKPHSPLFSTQVDFLVFNDRSSLSLNSMLTFSLLQKVYFIQNLLQIDHVNFF